MKIYRISKPEKNKFVGTFAETKQEEDAQIKKIIFPIEKKEHFLQWLEDNFSNKQNCEKWIKENFGW
jgi:hypothetical protein